MKILKSHQLAAADQYTITHEPIGSIDLMERAGHKIFDFLRSDFNACNTFSVFCGPGNNGCDGLVIARLLESIDKKVEVLLLKGTVSEEFAANLEKVKASAIQIIAIDNIDDLNHINIQPDTIIIDALFGNGISRPLEGLASELVQKINTLPNIKIAIDLPSGMSPDLIFKSDDTNTVMADLTYTIQLPKFAFMFAENSRFSGHFKCVDISLSEDFIHHQNTPHIYLDDIIIKTIIKPRAVFGHKGSFGHAMIIAGSAGKIGASILSSWAALKTGCGLLTAFIPEQAEIPMNCNLPEAMVVNRTPHSGKMDFSVYHSIGFGPGIGTDEKSSDLLFELLNLYHAPLVIDADGLNCLSNNPTWYGYLKSNIILTPHPGEFDRLTHPHESCYERYLSQQHFSKKHQVTLVLKGHHTSITTPSGLSYFNATGNNGMATAGSGDVLTGIITSLCAQGYTPENAAILGVYLHGFAGDVAAEKQSKTSLIASDIIEGIKSFFKKFER